MRVLPWLIVSHQPCKVAALLSASRDNKLSKPFNELIKKEFL